MRNNNAKPFIKWAGGKGQLLQTIECFLPEKLSRMENVTYIEPFIGGGAMLFFMLQRFQNISRAVINDINSNLVAVYKTVRDNPEMLIKGLSAIQREYYAIDSEEKRKEFFLSVRKTYNTEELADIDKSILLIFLNKTCFNGLYRVNSKGEFNVPFGKYSNPLICDEATIMADNELLQNVEIVCGDFEQTERYVTENTFIYFDPPYRPLDATSNFNSYAKEAFGDAEQIRLKKYFDRLSLKNCTLLLSNSDCRVRNPEDMFFDDLYKDYIIERVYASRSVNANPEKRGKLTELLIRNYTDTQQLSMHARTRRNVEPNIRKHEQSPYRRTV